MIGASPIAMSMEPPASVFGLPLITATTAAAARRANLSTLYVLTGVNGAAWRALRRENDRRVHAAGRHGTKLGRLELLSPDPYRRPAGAR